MIHSDNKMYSGTKKAQAYHVFPGHQKPSKFRTFSN